MTDPSVNVMQFKNEDCPFTELFSLLKRYEQKSNGTSLGYDSEELLAIHQHVGNAMVVLLHGIQDVGNLIGLIAPDRIDLINTLDNLGLFISTMGNLTEALNSLREDTDGELRERGVINY